MSGRGSGIDIQSRNAGISEHVGRNLVVELVVTTFKVPAHIVGDLPVEADLRIGVGNIDVIKITGSYRSGILRIDAQRIKVTVDIDVCVADLGGKVLGYVIVDTKVPARGGRLPSL